MRKRIYQPDGKFSEDLKSDSHTTARHKLKSTDIEISANKPKNLSIRWFGDEDLNVKQDWKNLKVLRLRHRNRDSWVKANPLNLVLIYMGEPSRQHALFEGRNIYNLQTKGTISLFSAFQESKSWYDDTLQDDLYLFIEDAYIKKIMLGIDLDPDKTQLVTKFGKRHSQIETLGRLALSEIQNGNIGGNLYADSLATALSVHLLQDFSNLKIRPFQDSKGLSPNKLRRILDLIDANLYEDLSLTILANEVGLSEYYFLKLFKKSTRMSPHQYIIRQRIERAKNLLSATNLSVTEISYLLGFSNPSHFSMTFRRHVGVPPNTFRYQTRR